MRFGLKIELAACYEKHGERLLRRRSYLVRLLFGCETAISRKRENRPSLSENNQLSDALSPNLLGVQK